MLCRGTVASQDAILSLVCSGRRTKVCFFRGFTSYTDANTNTLTSKGFVDMLNKMRVGELEPPAIEQFKRLKRELWYEDDIQPTQLYV